MGNDMTQMLESLRGHVRLLGDVGWPSEANCGMIATRDVAGVASRVARWSA